MEINSLPFEKKHDAERRRRCGTTAFQIDCLPRPSFARSADRWHVSRASAGSADHSDGDGRRVRLCVQNIPQTQVFRDQEVSDRFHVCMITIRVCRKKKKSNDSREKAELQAETVSDVQEAGVAAEPTTADAGLQLTKEEKSFLQMQEKRVSRRVSDRKSCNNADLVSVTDDQQTSRILEKARKSHKKRVEVHSCLLQHY